jgi:hypothetical protein
MAKGKIGSLPAPICFRRQPAQLARSTTRRATEYLMPAQVLEGR